MYLCDGFPEISTQLEDGVGQSAMGISALCYIYATYLVYWFSRDLSSIGGGVGSICHEYMCILLYMTSLVQWFSRHLCLIGGGDQVNLR